jgi:hypothetical protein
MVPTTTRINLHAGPYIVRFESMPSPYRALIPIFSSMIIGLISFLFIRIPSAFLVLSQLDQHNFRCKFIRLLTPTGTISCYFPMAIGYHIWVGVEAFASYFLYPDRRRSSKIFNAIDSAEREVALEIPPFSHPLAIYLVIKIGAVGHIGSKNHERVRCPLFQLCSL